MSTQKKGTGTSLSTKKDIEEIKVSIARLDEKFDAMKTEISQSNQAVVEKVQSAVDKFCIAIDALKGSIDKVIIGLLAIVAANVGVEFLPHSPIDWLGATTYMGKFLGIFVLVFLAFQLIRVRFYSKAKSKAKDCLIIGLLCLSLSLLLNLSTALIPYCEILVWITRIGYIVFLGLYAWQISPETNGVLEACEACEPEKPA